MKEFVEERGFKNNWFAMFTEIAYRGILPDKQVDRMLNSIKPEVKMNEDVDYDERKETLKCYHIKDINDLIFEVKMTEEEEREYKENQIQFILDNNLDLR